VLKKKGEEDISSAQYNQNIDLILLDNTVCLLKLICFVFLSIKKKKKKKDKTSTPKKKY
jgi:hypothetical protein